MPKVISVQSFRRGTGKSNMAVNVATLLAAEGRRVGVIDTDIQSPSAHLLFGLDEADIHHSLNDYLWGKCGIEQTIHDITDRLNGHLDGQLFLIPASARVSDIVRVLRDGYDLGLLNEAVHYLVDHVALDVLVVDTHAGLNEATLLAIALADSLAIILRPDQQDYQGTGLTVEVARKLNVPRLLLVVNEVLPIIETAQLKLGMETVYNCEVAAILPHSAELIELSSAGVFVLHYPNHLMTALYREIASKLVQ